jgi:hypothetical protein
MFFVALWNGSFSNFHICALRFTLQKNKMIKCTKANELVPELSFPEGTKLPIGIKQEPATLRPCSVKWGRKDEREEKRLRERNERQRLLGRCRYWDPSKKL